MTAPPTPRTTSWWRSRRIAIIVGSLAVIYAIIVGVLVLQSSPNDAAEEAGAVLIAVGNLGGPDSSEANDLAALLADHRMDALALLGDLAPPDGSAATFSNQYQPLFGAYDDEARPAPGDVEYATADAAGYFNYYRRHGSSSAADPYYAFTLAGWRIYALDSQRTDTHPGEEMYEWLRSDLGRTTQPCVAAFWHDPVYSAGPGTSDEGDMQLVFDLLAGYGADVVLSAHDSNYQRWAPIDGITSFVVGTGGAAHAAPTRADEQLVTSNASSAGALQLELSPGGAGYRFMATDGTVVDSGSLPCHGRPAEAPPRPATPTSLTASPSPDGVALSWTQVTGVPEPIGYLVFRGSEPIAFSEETTYVDASLPAGASVLYSVRSVTASGARSAPSEAAHSGGEAPGFTDFVWAPLDKNPSAPTADKPQSKLWWMDGAWWGILFGSDPARPSHSAYFIQRFDLAGQAWTNTGVEVDERDRSRADALWDPDSENLYVLSTIASGAIKLYRYSFIEAQFTLDEGFPLRLTENGSESATLAKDSTGVLWVTMTQVPDGTGPCLDGQPCEVKVMHSTDEEYRWTEPVTVPTAGSTVDPDDISTVVSFGDDSIGVAWSNQLESDFHFAIHADGAPDTQWSLETVVVAPRGSDDHLNLKSDSAGRVYLLGKTSLNDPANSQPTAPLVMLFVRETDGAWRRATVWEVRHDVTRPGLVVDEKGGQIYAVAAQPGTGGAIVAKAATIANLDFGTDLGTVLMAGGSMNNPTLTKQTVDLRDGILVLAADSDSHTYWHNVITPATVLVGGG